ncbi:DNA (cytosine-5-)-methyltransferase [Campylobacter sp. RM16192]|uniref:DNA (cytosine-5-)-methyltransferase n=1 Tax=Campylobacter sp. RM16192 TaxID=1660080 RepID=UPI0014524AA1|nr:DNA (cytosine-5-)-methyltransferase [Campylobacter sp. RM16192]QCD52118.1 cytosine-specific DNA methyltransferase [Campylobacter sp. RM16192]
MIYRVGSLFAGVGGVCQAFKNSNCNIVWANEIDRSACKTYRLNHKNTNLIEDDVRNINNKNLDDIDILTAGFPCQPFSQAGHGKGFEDERGKLFFEVSRLLKELKPKAYFLENVRTLTSHNNGKTFQTIKEELKYIGYSFIPFVLNASKYTNIPQGRERIYIVGFRDESDYCFNKPIKENILETSRNNLLSAKFQIPKPTNKTLKNIKSFLDDNHIMPSDIYNNQNNEIHRKIMDSVIDENTVYQYRRYYVRSNKSNVCPTLTANMGAGGHNIPIILNNGIIRRLNPKECFNLQGFPQDFMLPEGISRAQLYRQAGNSVVVPMVEKIAKEIVAVLDAADRS